IIVFKQTVSIGEKIKGNCDAELVLKTVSDYYKKEFSSCYLITGDGDFGCLVEFLKDNNSIHGIIAPDKNKCSFLLRNKNVEITFLNKLYHKFSNEIKEKAPDADVSA
ncbi:MAG: NYN domain-containing protein, partial [bacterium]